MLLGYSASKEVVRCYRFTWVSLWYGWTKVTKHKCKVTSGLGSQLPAGNSRARKWKLKKMAYWIRSVVVSLRIFVKHSDRLPSQCWAALDSESWKMMHPTLQLALRTMVFWTHSAAVSGWEEPLRTKPIFWLPWLLVLGSFGFRDDEGEDFQLENSGNETPDDGILDTVGGRE